MMATRLMRRRTVLLKNVNSFKDICLHEHIRPREMTSLQQDRVRPGLPHPG